LRRLCSGGIARGDSGYCGVDFVAVGGEFLVLAAGGRIDRDAKFRGVRRIYLPQSGIAGIHQILQGEMKVVEQVGNEMVGRGVHRWGRGRGRGLRVCGRSGHGWARSFFLAQLFDVESGNRLRFSVVVQLKIFDREVADALTATIADYYRDRNEVAGGAKEDRGVLGCHLRGLGGKSKSEPKKQKAKTNPISR